MRKLIAYVAALGAAPIVALAVMQSVAPAFADTPGVSPTCFPQTANPHPTDPAAQTTNVLFCTNPNSSGSGSGAGKTGTGTGTTAGAGTTAGGGQTSLAGSSGTGSTPDESGHSLNGTWSSGSGKPAASTDTGLFGGLVGFFASAGGMVFLFGLLMLMLIVLIALGVIAALRRGGKNFASRFSRVSYRA
jgi:hypothetical protein